MATDTVTQTETCSVCGDVVPSWVLLAEYPDADGVLRTCCPRCEPPEGEA